MCVCVVHVHTCASVKLCGVCACVACVHACVQCGDKVTSRQGNGHVSVLFTAV